MLAYYFNSSEFVHVVSLTALEGYPRRSFVIIGRASSGHHILVE